MARADPVEGTGVRGATARSRRGTGEDLPPHPDPELDRLSRPMPPTTRLAEEPVVLPVADGVAMRLPDALKTRFRRAFADAVFDRTLRVYLVTGPDARERVDAWLARAARTPAPVPKTKAPPLLRLT